MFSTALAKRNNHRGDAERTIQQMNRKRWFVKAVTLAACICLGLGVFALLVPDDRPGATNANFERIEKGMTTAEVQAIFGEPPFLEQPDSLRPGHVLAWWKQNEGHGNFVVIFSKGGFVILKEHTGIGAPWW